MPFIMAYYFTTKDLADDEIDSEEEEDEEEKERESSCLVESNESLDVEGN